MNIVLIQRSFGRRHIVGIPEDIRITGEFGRSEAFEAFNGFGTNRHLREFADYSMSVGDIIGLDDQWSLCESSGWTDLSFHEVQEAVADLIVGREYSYY